MKNIILFGGSFNPIHLGHLKMAKIASDEFDADIFFIPSKNPVWKNDCIDISHRIKMLELALKDFNCDRFNYSLIEAESDDTTYTIDTVNYFLNNYQFDNLYLLIGEDQVIKFHRWKSASELAKKCKIIFFPRDDSDEINENELIYNIKRVKNSKMYHVSSTEIRNLSTLMTTKSVIDYMVENALYSFNQLAYIYSNKRYAHAISVANLAYEIAISNNIPHPDRYYLAAIMHDVGKNIAKKTVEQIMVENFFNEFETMPEFSFHQFVGMHIAKNTFNIKDVEILDAIKYHATGRKNMTLLEKVIYASDKIEPTRGFDSKELIDSMKKDANEGFKIVLQANKEYLLEQHKDIENKLTNDCMKQYL